MRSSFPTIRFFEPDIILLHSLRKYIGKRMVLDIGCGGGDLLKELQLRGVGVDPHFSGNTMELLQQGIHIFPEPVQECERFLQKIFDRSIVIFARPCHSNFVEQTLDMMPSGVEALYITVPENLEAYDDLGKWKPHFKQIHFEGKSKDNEVFYSMTKS